MRSCLVRSTLLCDEAHGETCVYVSDSSVELGFTKARAVAVCTVLGVVTALSRRLAPEAAPLFLVPVTDSQTSVGAGRLSPL